MKRAKQNTSTRKKPAEPRYLLVVEYSRIDVGLELDLEKIVGRRVLRTGFSFMAATWDISWGFVQLPAARSAAGRVRRHRRKGMRVQVRKTGTSNE